MARIRSASFAVVLLLAARGAADEAVWIGPAVGAWNVPANWSTGVVPGSNTSALIDDNPAQSTRVESRVNVSSIGMTGIDSGDTLAVINSSFGTSRALVLDGTVSLEGSNAQFSAALVMDPGSELRLAGTFATATTTGLFNQGNIHGGGILALGTSTTTTTAYNESTIRADNPTIQLTLNTPGSANLENDGRLIASGGGKLLLQRGSSGSLTDFGVIGGRIEAYPASTVIVGSATGTAYVEDSVLAMMDDNDPLTAAPLFQFNGELKNVSLEGNFKMSGASIIGSLTNPADLSPGTTQSSMYHNTLEGDVLLRGGGTVTLGASTLALFGSGPGTTTSRLTNVDNVIHGKGELLVSWYGFNNKGVVQADAGQNAELLFYNGLSAGLLVNSGVMKATNGGRLRLGYSSGATSQMENFEGSEPGEIVAGQNSSVLLNLIHIKGGVLRPEGSDAATRGKFLGEPGVVLEDVTLDGIFRLQTLAGQLSTITLQNKNHNKGSLTSRFTVSTTSEVDGGGEIIAETGTFMTLGQFATFINDDNLIHGSGNITSSFSNTSFTNRGTVRADGNFTFFNQMQVVNRGRLEAGPGAILNLPTFGTVLNQENGVAGTIFAANGGVVNLSKVDGGILSTEGTGVNRASAGTLIKDVHNLGTLEVTSALPQGIIVNDGVIKGSLRLESAYVRFDGSGQWDGAAGTLTGFEVVNGPQHTILGNGDLGQSSSFAGSAFQNQGVIRAKEGPNASFRIFAASFENAGLAHAPVGRTLSINSLFARATNSGTLQVDGNMEVNSPVGLYNETGGLIDVRGKLTIKETRLRNRAGGKITGTGEIIGPIAVGALVVNEGVIEPGSGLATLTIGDDFQQLASGQLKMEVSGGTTLANDLLQVNGAASLGGSLAVSRVGDAALAAGNSFTLLAATAGVSGTFQQLSMPALTSDLFWYVQYAPNAVRAIVAEVIPGDFSRDGSVGADDYLWLRTHAGTVEQYNEWRANFGRTLDLGQSALQSAVPEPTSSFILVAGAICALVTRRRR